MKKFLSYVLVLAAISTTLCVPAFAASKDSEESQTQVVETVYDDNKLVTTFDEDMVTMERYSLETEELVVSVQWKKNSDYITVTKDGCTTSELISPVEIEGNTQNSVTRARTMSNSTEMGYAYTLTYSTPYYWNLSCPKYDDGGDTVFSFVCTERDSYYDKLQSFKEDVDNMNAIEKKIEARTSAKILNTAFAVAFAATGTPEGFAFAFSAWFANQGYDVEIQDLAADMGVYQKDAYDKYWRIQKEWTDLLRLDPSMEVR